MAISLILGFIGGIVLGSIFPINVGFFVALVSLTLVFFVYRYFVDKNSRKVLNIILFVFLGVLFGVWRIMVSDLYSDSKLDEYVGKQINIEGIIVGEPDVRETNTKLTIGVRSVVSGTTTVSVREKILVTVPIYPEFSYGDKVRAKVVLEEPGEFETNGRVFDYKGYLRVRGIWYTSRFTSVDFISGDHGSFIKTFLFKTKSKFTDSINDALPDPESNLLTGLLLGTKQSLGKELLTEFQKTGVSHIVVLSGYNIAIVAGSIMAFFKFLPKNMSFSFGAVSIILFTILSGGGASAWRAAIMVLVALFAKKFNRDYKASRVFGFTIVLMLAPNPLLLVFDPSFQLSVLATIGLIFVTPFITPYLLWITEKFGLREIVSSTTATQVTVLPYLIYNMGLLSLVSLPVNVLILGTIPPTMSLGFITGVLGLFSVYLSFVPAFFTYILLWYQLKIVHIGASVPFGVLSLPAFSPVLLILAYLILIIVLKYLRDQKN